MINYFLCIIWPVLIFGSIGAYKLGKRSGGLKVSILMMAGFWLICISILMGVFGKWWLDFLWMPYFAQ